jgi:S-DNA-T family DNA segregation ATPase FtsK/SpoIIIE
MYEIALKEGTKLATVVTRADDLAIALKAESVRIVAPIPGKNTIGVEVPNVLRDDVRLHGLLAQHASQGDKKAIPIFLGSDAAGNPMVEDLSTMPHLLIAGATGSGKSVCINSIILSVLMARRPEEVRLILIDPKQVELAFFRDIPHLLTAVVTDARKAAQTLDWVVNEMEDRYRIFALFGVRNIAAYNRLGVKKIRELAKQHDVDEQNAPEHMPYLVVVVDELADLIMTGRKEVESSITRLAQKSRAVGIHSVLATQRPSTDVITGLIKANMPSRISFKVTSKVDSRVVLDQAGADKLLGRGDMLFLPPRSFHLVRAQGCYVSDPEVKDVVQFLRENGPGQDLRELIVRHETLDDRDPNEVDDLFDSACRIVLEQKRGSASLLQRALQIGYTRASRLIDLMRGQGIIGEFKNAQAADVLLTLEEYEAKYGKEEAEPS